MYWQPTNTPTTCIPSHNPKKQTWTSAEGQRPHNVHPSLLQNSTYQEQARGMHTQRVDRVLSFGRKRRFLSGCHCVLTGYLQRGRRLSTAETVSKCPTLIWGLWKEPTSWVNSMKGHRAERPAWVYNYSIIFQIYGCATSSTVILALGVPTNVLLQHICLIAFIQYSNLHPMKDDC